MAFWITLTVNDVKGSNPAGYGASAREATLAGITKALHGENYVVSGFTAPASDPDLTMPIAAGEAMISGFRVVSDAAENVTVTNAATNHVFLKLTRDGLNNVTGAALVANTTGTPPADSVKLCTAVAAGGAITSTADARPIGFNAARAVLAALATLANVALTAEKVNNQVFPDERFQITASVGASRSIGAGAESTLVQFRVDVPAGKILKLRRVRLTFPVEFLVRVYSTAALKWTSPSNDCDFDADTTIADTSGIKWISVKVYNATGGSASTGDGSTAWVDFSLE